MYKRQTKANAQENETTLQGESSGATKRNQSQPVRKHASSGNDKSHQLRKCKAVVPEKHDAYADELVDARQDRMDIPHDGVPEPKPAKDTTDAILRKALKAMKEKKA